MSSTTGRWSHCEASSDNVEKLRYLCHHRARLRKAGYVTAPLHEDTIFDKLRCEKCGKPMMPPRPTSNDYLSRHMLNLTISTPEDKDPCIYHTGNVSYGNFSCCGQRANPANHGCTTALKHTAHADWRNVLRQHWLYHHSTTNSAEHPSASAESKGRNPSKSTPDPIRNDFRKAVALDCEMGINKYNATELIRLSAIDFFSQEILIDTLVIPSISMRHYNTRYSGVTAGDMRNADRRNTCIRGRDAARDALLRFVGPETVIVMHGGHNDLTALRLIHPHVLDTLLLDEQFPPVFGGRNLKNLCAQRVGIDIQNRKRLGHDSVEDTFACRELAVWMMNEIPVKTAEDKSLTNVEKESSPTVPVVGCGADEYSS